MGLSTGILFSLLISCISGQTLDTVAPPKPAAINSTVLIQPRMPVVPVKPVVNAIKPLPPVPKVKPMVKQVKESRPVTPKPFDCARENFNQVFSDCCKEATGQLFKQEARYKCYIFNEYIWSLGAITHYNLNRFQLSKSNNLDMSGKVAASTLNDMKFTECLFKAEGLLTFAPEGNSSLNTAKMSPYFQTISEVTEAKLLLQKAAENCVSIILSIAPSLRRSDVDTSPYLMLQCIKRELLMTCTIPEPMPEQKTKEGTFKVFADMCITRRNRLKLCPLHV